MDGLKSQRHCDLCDPSKGGYDAKTLKVGLVTGGITR